MTTRRDFIAELGAAVGGARLLTWPRETFDRRLEGASCGPASDPSVGRSPTTRVGYAAITWGGNDLQAIDDISALGYPGIQLRSNVLERFGERPAELRELLASHHLTLVALSSGAVRVDSASDDDMIAEHARHAKFVRDVGGLYLQVTDERPRNRPPTAADYSRLGKLLTEIGKRSAEVGIPLGYHNHMGGLGEQPRDVDRVLDAADPRYVKLLLDVAHYRQADGDPAHAIRAYHERLLFLHIKDVERIARDASASRAENTYRFVELGRGLVDLPAVFTALREVSFDGWAVIELDGVTEPGRSAKQSAEMNRQYIEERMGIRVR